MRVLILSAVAVLGLAACSNGEAAKGPAAPAAPPAAPIQPPGRPAIYAAQPIGPAAFVNALYAVYVAGGPKDDQPPPGRDPIYSRMLNATIGADVRVAKGEVPTLNYDPLCGCQDQGDFALNSVAISQTGVNAATADVVFTNLGTQTRQTLKLVREGVSWKVDDVVDSEGKSLSGTLLAVITAAGG
ncbi:hypothetical protein BH10PSE2_BH10PSE2_18890 [soil metagenome]